MAEDNERREFLLQTDKAIKSCYRQSWAGSSRCGNVFARRNIAEDKTFAIAEI